MNIESFFKISYGLYLVSTQFEGHKNAYIANTVFQITAEPARFAISCHKDNLSSGLISSSGKFAFTILESNTDQSLISRFGYKSGREINKFEDVEYFETELGNPILKQNAIAYFECEVEQTVDIGTHKLFIGLLKANEMLDASKEPLTYADYKNLRNGKAPKNAPTYIKPTEDVKEVSTETNKNTKYECEVCGYIYDPSVGDIENGIEPGTAFEDLSDDWVCPECAAEKEDFTPIK